MNNNDVVTHRELALDALASAQVYKDLVSSLHERRLNEPGSAVEVSRLLSEANSGIGVALKVADVHATLAVAEALGSVRGRRCPGCGRLLDFAGHVAGCEAAEAERVLTELTSAHLAPCPVGGYHVYRLDGSCVCGATR